MPCGFGRRDPGGCTPYPAPLPIKLPRHPAAPVGTFGAYPKHNLHRPLYAQPKQTLICWRVSVQYLRNIRSLYSRNNALRIFFLRERVSIVIFVRDRDGVYKNKQVTIVFCVRRWNLVHLFRAVSLGVILKSRNDANDTFSNRKRCIYNPLDDWFGIGSGKENLPAGRQIPRVKCILPGLGEAELGYNPRC